MLKVCLKTGQMVSKSYPKPVQVLIKICPKWVQSKYRICKRSNSIRQICENMFNNWPTYVQSLSNICAKKLSRFCSTFFRNMFEICTNFVQIMYKICSNPVQNLSKMCPHSAQSLLEFCWKIIQNIFFSKTVTILSKSGIFCRNLFKIRPVPVKQKPTIKIFLTLSKVSSKYVQNMFKINLRSVWVLLICAHKYAHNM